MVALVGLGLFVFGSPNPGAVYWFSYRGWLGLTIVLACAWAYAHLRNYPNAARRLSNAVVIVAILAFATWGGEMLWKTGFFSQTFQMAETSVTHPSSQETETPAAAQFQTCSTPPIGEVQTCYVPSGGIRGIPSPALADGAHVCQNLINYVDVTAEYRNGSTRFSIKTEDGKEQREFKWGMFRVDCSTVLNQF